MAEQDIYWKDCRLWQFLNPAGQKFLIATNGFLKDWTEQHPERKEEIAKKILELSELVDEDESMIATCLEVISALLERCDKRNYELCLMRNYYETEEEYLNAVQKRFDV